jgi:hypothetical protein
MGKIRLWRNGRISHGWNLWVYAVIVTGAIIFVIPTDLGYILGAAGAWIPASKLATLALTGGVMVGITLVAIHGLISGNGCTT